MEVEKLEYLEKNSSCQVKWNQTGGMHEHVAACVSHNYTLSGLYYVWIM